MIIKKPSADTHPKINPREIQKSYMDRIEHDLVKQGIVLFDETHLNIEGEYLILPADITDTPSQLIGRYLNAFTQQKMYVRTLLGREELILEEAKREYGEASDPVYLMLNRDTKTKYSETAKDRIVNADPSVKDKLYAYSDHKRKLRVLEIAIANIEDAIFLLSREVTRRNGDFADDNRNYNVGRK